MLNQFRDFSGSIVTKLLLVLLIASFAMWGIGDMLGKGVGHSWIAKVGNHTIKVDNYRREFAIESDNIRRQLGANYSQELLKRMNVPEFVLRRMVQEALLRQEAERMGFIPDDTTVALEIRKNQAFMNHSGVFDKARFESMLRNQGMSEKTYVEKLRMQLATDKLLDALVVDLPISDTMLSSLQAAYNQGRTVTIYKLTGNATTKTPSNEELARFHKEHAEQFTQPEYRTVSYIRFSAKDAEVKANLSEEAARSYYNTHADQFRTPEKREIEQLLYSDEEQAKEAYNQVKIGKKFSEVAAAIEPLNKGSLSLGAVDQKTMLEDAADEVFRLKTGGVTAPVKSPFGWHIFRVVAIEPEGTQSFEKVRPQIEQQLKQEAAENALTDKINQVEDALAGGSTLKEAASSLGLKVEQAGTFDAKGNTPQGAENTSIPKLDKFVDVAFRTSENTESSVITSRDGMYYVLRVDAITQEKLRPLADIKQEVLKAYAIAEQERASADLASMIEKELAAKKTAKEIITSHNLSATTSGTVGRNSKNVDSMNLPPALVNAIFVSDVGSVTPPVRDKNGDYILAQVTGIAANGGSDKTVSAKDLKQQMQDELMVQYLRSLESRYPVEIDESVLNQLLQDNSDAAR